MRIELNDSARDLATVVAIIAMLFAFVVLFAGTPDLMDAIIYHVTNGEVSGD